MRNVVALLLLAVGSLSVAADPKSGWEAQSSIGVTLNGGNADTQSYLAKLRGAYHWLDDSLRLSGQYLYGRANDQESARNWNAETRYDHYVSERWGTSAGLRGEGDIFAGLRSRWSGDVGAKYYFTPRANKDDYAFAEVGYRYQYEERTPDQYLNNHLGRVFLEGKKTLREGVFARFWVELLPNLSYSNHYMINFEPSVSIALNRALSVVMAFNGRYDGLPAAGKKNFDYLYTTSVAISY